MSIKLKGIQVPGMTETEKITGFGIKEDPSDPSPVVVWKGSANLIYNGTIPTGSTVIGLGEYDADTNYTVTFTADSKYVYTAKTATTTGNPGSWTETGAVTIQGASYYTTLTYSGIADEDITFTATPAHYRNVSITLGSGLKEVFFSKNLDGSSPLSGTSINIFDGIIYAFAKLDIGYNAASGWTLVSGTADSENAIYRIGSDNGLVDYDFGTINAVIKTFTITWRYLSAYPDTYTTSNVVYNYGDTPGTSTPVSGTVPTPSTVTSGNARKVPTTWDNLSVVTAARTINMQYQLQYYADISSIRCTADLSSDWYNSGTVITWTAGSDTNVQYSFENTSNTVAVTTKTATINSAVGTYSANAQYNYFYVNVSPSTGFTADYSSGWQYIKEGVNVTFTIPTPTAIRKISFSDTYDTTSTATTTCTTAGQTISEPTNYVWMNCTFSGNHCSCNLTDGWLVCDSRIIWTADYDDNTGTYYSFIDLPYTPTDNGSTVTDGRTSYSASANYIYYQITVYAASGCSVTSNGTGKYLKDSRNTTTWGVSNTNTQTFSSAGTAQNITTSTWTADSSKEISSPTVYTRTYSVAISKSTGISSVYLSIYSTAVTGDSSGTRYSYNTTVYGFAVLAEGYNAPSDWTLVSGTANTTGAKYMIGSKTTTSNQNFGNISANIKTFNCYADPSVSVTLNGTTVSGNFTANYFDTLSWVIPPAWDSEDTYEIMPDPEYGNNSYSSGYRQYIKNKWSGHNMQIRADSSSGTILYSALSYNSTYTRTSLSADTKYNYYLSCTNRNAYYTHYYYWINGYTNTSYESVTKTITITTGVSIEAPLVYSSDQSYRVNYDTTISMISGKQLSCTASGSNIDEKTCRITFKNTTGNRADNTQVTVRIYYKESSSSSYISSVLLTGNGASTTVNFPRPSYVGGSGYYVYYYATYYYASYGDKSSAEGSVWVSVGQWS